MNSFKKKYSFEEAYQKLMSYCAYQERSGGEIKTKALQLGLSKTQTEKALSNLEKDNFYNERRFANAFISGKIQIKRWGKYKLMDGLFQKGVNQELSQELMLGIDENIYLNNLRYWIEYKKEREVDSTKIYRFILSKGYESDLIIREMKLLKLM